MKAADVMVSNVITVGVNANIGEVAAILLHNHISAAPVVDEKGELVGIVSEGDLIRLRLRERCIERSFAPAGWFRSDIFRGRHSLCVKPTPEPAVRDQHRKGEYQHCHQPTHGAREKCCVDLWKRKFRELLPALDHPVPSHVRDERRHDDDAQPLRDHVSEDEIERGDQHDQHGDLADFHADIEPEQRGHQMVAGELKRLAQRE